MSVSAPLSPAQRKKQPNCRACSHALTFHANGASPCRANGCPCETWTGASVKEVATGLRRTERWVRENAPSLEGVKVGGSWVFPRDFKKRLREQKIAI